MHRAHHGMIGGAPAGGYAAPVCKRVTVVDTGAEAAVAMEIPC